MSSRALSGASQAFARRPVLYGALAMFALLVPLYCFSIGLRATRGAPITGDEPFYLATTQSIVDDFDLDLRNQYESQSYLAYFNHPDGLWLQSPPDAEGRILSPHNPGLSVLVIPGFVVGGLTGVQVELLLIAALAFALSYVLVAQETERPLASWMVTAAVALSATPFVYATEVYPEVPAGCCLVAALLVAQLSGREVLRGLAVVALLTAMEWLSVKYAPLGCLVAAHYLWRVGWRPRAWFTGAAAVSGVAFVAFHLATYGHLTPYSVNLVYNGSSSVELLESHLGFSDRFYRLYGLFIDQRFGVGRWAPLLLLVLPSLPLLTGKQPLRWVVGGLIVAQIGIATFLAITMMGWWFPGRTLMTVLPLMALPLTLLVVQLPAVARWAAGALAGLGLLITAALLPAVHRDGIRIAVDPFDMDVPGFQALGRLFPNYQAWTLETSLLTGAWLVLLVASLAWTLPRSEVWRLRPRWRWRPALPSHVPAGSSVQQPPAR